MATSLPDWLTVERRAAPLIVSIPHAGIKIPPEIEARCASPWLARKDADWWIDKLYDFVPELGATVVRTSLSRTVIDVNRDPSGASLYPGQATTDLVPVTTFDGEPLWQPGQAPGDLEVAHRRQAYFVPYHKALAEEVARVKALYPRIVVYDCHSIRSAIPRLFEGELPVLNIGTSDGASCDSALERAVADVASSSSYSTVVNGRFKGGYITRAYGRPRQGVHAVQMEVACRGYMKEVVGPVREGKWPVPYDAGFAADIRATLRSVLEACLRFAREGKAA